MILVTGATGNVGSALVGELKAAGADFKALVRNPEKAEALKADGVEVVMGDLGKPDTLAAALEGADKVFLLSSVAPEMAEVQINLIDAAKESGSPHIVRMSAVKASSDSPMRIGRLHAEADAYLEASGLPYTILRPHFFMQNVMMGAQSVAAEGKLYMSFAKGELGMVDVRDIASSAAAILTADDDRFLGKTYTPTGPESISLEAVAGALSSALGKPVDYVDVPIDGSRQAMMGMGFPEWMVEGYLEYFQSYSTGWGDFANDDVNSITGKPAHSIAQFAEDFASAFQGG